jgi:ribonuclease HII
MVEICGIDEAGRGPVIGPLVICGMIVDSDDENELKELGVKDSKQITPKKREELFEILSKKYKYELSIINPTQLDADLEREDSNLNYLEAKESAIIILKLDPDKVFMDCPSTNIKAYTKTMKTLVDDSKIKIICEHKADINHIEASCASIIAKVTRDRIIKELHKVHGDFGSGYPSDPKTKEFVAANFAKKECKGLFRTTWQTYKNVASAKQQNKLNKFF